MEDEIPGEAYNPKANGGTIGFQCFFGGSMKHGDLAVMVFCALMLIAAVVGKLLIPQ